MNTSYNESAIQESVRYLKSAEAIRSIEANPYWPKWNSPWWHMSALFEVGMADLIPKATAEKMLSEVKRTHLPYFFSKDAPAGKGHDQDAPCPCSLGNIYQILSATGLDVDAALPWAREWFFKYQMPDGGLNCDEDAYQADPGSSSLVGTIACLEAIISTTRPLTANEEQFLDHGARCLIDRELRLGSSSRHNAEERHDEADWLKPCFPRFYFYDVLRGLTFILKWADRRNQTIPKDAIAEVIRHLEMQNPDGQIRIKRHSYEGVSTKVQSESWDWKRRESASHFPLLDHVSQIGEISPYLTAQWADVRELMGRLKARGLLRWPMKVTENYEICYPNPLNLKVGDRIQLFVKDVPEKWLGWNWCKDVDGNEGWISDTYFKRSNATEASIVKNYHAKEIAVREGSLVDSLITDCGWSWCRKSDGDEGWLPSEILE